MAPATRNPHIVSIKPIFLRARDAAQPGFNPQPNTRLHDPQSRADPHSDRRDSNRVSKIRESTSLDQYRSGVSDRAKNDLGKVEKSLVTSLEELTTGIEAHVENLAEIEEPLQRAFTAEALANIRSKSDVDQADIEEVFLRDRMARFREMREDKERILCKLWDEWEDIQFELISLAIEVLGDEALGIPFGEEALKPGQKERLDNTCESAQQIHEHINVQHGNLEQDLTSFKEVMTQITDTTKKTVADTQQQYNVQKNRLFKGLNRHIELLAAL